LLGELTGDPDGATCWSIPHVATDKPDFGDLDVLVRDDLMTPRFLNDFHARVQAREHRHIGMAESYLTPVPGSEDALLQVDLFPTPAALMTVRREYMDYGDLGNLLGRLARYRHLYWQDSGLVLDYRRAQDDTYLRALSVTGGRATLIRLCGLDPARLDTPLGENDLFAWLCTSPSLRSEAFTDGRSLERKGDPRPGMRRFQAYVQAAVDEGRVQPAARLERQPVEMLFADLNALGLDGEALRTLWEEEVREEQRAAALSERWNADMIALTRPDFSKLQVQMLRRQVREDRARQDWMLTQPPDRVTDWLRALPAPTVTAQMEQSFQAAADQRRKNQHRKQQRQQDALLAANAGTPNAGTPDAPHPDGGPS